MATSLRRFTIRGARAGAWTFVAMCLIAGCASWRAVPAPTPAAALAPCTRADCLRVMTWNLHAIPFVTANPMARLGNVASKIREQQPDVVLLQEVWSHAFARRLQHRLRDQYRITTSTGCGRPFPCGGLAILVRIGSGWTASAPSFVAYEASGPWYRLLEWDYIAKKGMLFAHLTRGGETVGVLDTHLQTEYGRYGRNYSDIRRRQLEQLDATLSERFAQTPVVIGGDFNTAPVERSGLFQTHVATLGDDRTAEFRAECGQCGTRPTALRPGRWLDYVMTQHLAATSTLEPIRNVAVDVPFSDHDGLLVRLEYERGALE